jgi:uncharacterized protein
MMQPGAGERIGLEIMSPEEIRAIDLIDDTRLNVASLLLEPVGSTRNLRIELKRFILDDDLTARDVAAAARLTRLKAHILVDAEVTGVIPLECATCLREYDQPFRLTFTESFRQSVDVRTGADLASPRNDLDDTDGDDEPGFTIDDNHQIDLGEAFRQWILLSIPMQPSCGPDCPGPLLRSTEPEGAPDERFAQLADLLTDDDPVSGTKGQD